MKLTILYPGSYFDLKKVDEDYETEYQEAVKFSGFQIVFFNYDGYITGSRLKLYPVPLETGLCIYRGWMVKPEKYHMLYEELKEKGLNLINTPEQYKHSHEFPDSYPLIKEFTPPILTFHQGEPIDWDHVKTVFPRFMIKDYVKSVKGSSFPVFFDSSYSNRELEEYLEQFKRLRGELYTGGIVLKEFVNLKKANGTTNEYRAFYLQGTLLTLSPNSNQHFGAQPPKALTRRLPQLESRFYTIDFAELEDGRWMVIETGDGQVSGLSPGQYIFKFYEELLRHAVR